VSSDLPGISRSEATRNGVRVLFVGNFLSRGGGRRAVCEELSERLGDSGWHILLTSSVRARFPRLVDMVGTALSRREEYDLAHIDVFSDTAFYWAEALAFVFRSLRKPYILTLRGGDLPAFARRHSRRMRRLLGSAAAVTAPSTYLQEALSDWRADIQVLPNAIDITRYTFRHRMSPQPRLVWLRAFHAVYEPALGPETVAILRRDFPTVRLTMIGPDKGDGSFDETRRVAARLGVSGHVEFVAGVDKSAVPLALSGGDVFLNTSSVDNVPVSVMEALACGLCVVSTNAGGLPDLLDDGADALLVPAGNALAMAAATRRVLTESGLAGQISQRGREKVESMDWSVILPRWKHLFEAAVR
jgi:glycosyltransferase involved in cell wall biosynthesis